MAIGVDRGGEAALTLRGERRARCGARGGCPRRGPGCSRCGPASGQTWLPPPVSCSAARRVLLPAAASVVWLCCGDWRLASWRSVARDARTEQKTRDFIQGKRASGVAPCLWTRSRRGEEGPRPPRTSVRVPPRPRASGRGWMRGSRESADLVKNSLRCPTCWRKRRQAWRGV